MSSPREIAEGFITHKAEHGCTTLLSPQESETVCRAIVEIDPVFLRNLGDAIYDAMPQRAIQCYRIAATLDSSALLCGKYGRRESHDGHLWVCQVSDDHPDREVVFCDGYHPLLDGTTEGQG